MSNHQEVIDLAKALTGNENVYSVQPFIKITGDTLRGLFLERIVYWSDRSGNERLRQLKIFYKSADEWEDELGLSYAQVTLARKKLEEMGFIQTSKHKVSGAPTLHYYANMDAIKQAVIAHYQDKIIGYANLEKPEIQESSISENGNLQIEESAQTIEIEESASSLNNSSNSSSNSTKAASPPPTQKLPPLKPHTIPSVQVFVEVTGKYCLSKPQMKEVAEVIGDSPTSLEKWRGVVKEWLMRGFKPTNVAGMLEWFKGEIPVYQNGAKQNGYKSTKQQQIIPPTQAEQERLLRMRAATLNDPV